jgi:hypothetical protein
MRKYAGFSVLCGLDGAVNCVATVKRGQFVSAGVNAGSHKTTKPDESRVIESGFVGLRSKNND